MVPARTESYDGPCVEWARQDLDRTLHALKRQLMREPPDSDPLPTIPGPRAALRRITERDLGALVEIFGDPEVSRFIGIPRLRDEAGARALLRDIDQHAARGTLLQWGVVLACGEADGERGANATTPAGRLVGTCTLAHLDPTNRRAEIGFVLGRAHWGRGLMKDAVRLLLDHAFGTLGLHRIEADVDPRNVRSLRLLERLGFRREGHLRQRHRIAGEWQDSVLLGLLAPEWPAAPPERVG